MLGLLSGEPIIPSGRTSINVYEKSLDLLGSFRECYGGYIEERLIQYVCFL